MTIDQLLSRGPSYHCWYVLNVHRLFKSRNKVLAVMFTQAIVESLYLNIDFALFDENSGVDPCYVVDT